MRLGPCAPVMGICFSQCLGHSQKKREASFCVEDDFIPAIGLELNIPPNCLVSTVATCPVLKITQTDPVCLVEHPDFPFPLQLRLLGEVSPELRFWQDGHLRPFPFLKNVYWAWWQGAVLVVIEDACSSQLPIEDLEFQSIDDASQQLPLMLADALNHLHSNNLVHGAILPESLYYHTPTRTLKLGNLSHLQLIPRDGHRCTQAVPTCLIPNEGYFEEIDWYAFGRILQEWNMYPQLASKLIARELGHGPSAYTQVKHQLETRNKDWDQDE